MPKSVGLFSTNLDEGVYTAKINGKLKTISIKPHATTLLWKLRKGGYDNIVYNGVLK